MYPGPCRTFLVTTFTDSGFSCVRLAPLSSLAPREAPGGLGWPGLSSPGCRNSSSPALWAAEWPRWARVEGRPAAPPLEGAGIAARTFVRISIYSQKTEHTLILYIFLFKGKCLLKDYG